MSSSTLVKNEVLSTRKTAALEVDDESLLFAYRDTGNRLAFAELVHRYERELYSYLRRYLGDATTAEDAFQATFLQVHLNCHRFESGRAVRPWLYTIATNQAIDVQRRNRRHRMVSLDRRQAHNDEDAGALVDLLVSKETDPSDALESGERREWIRTAVAALPESLRMAVVLVYYQGMMYREAADVLNVPVGTVKSRMHMAVVKLNEAWKAEQDKIEIASHA